MPATRQQARDDATKVVSDAAILAGIERGNIVYDAKAGSKPSTDNPVKSWVRVQLRHINSSKTSLTGTVQRSRFTRNMNLTVQVFTPSGDGLEEENRIIPIIQHALEGKTTANGLQFFDVTANEIGEDGPWWMTNITARVEYDEFVET